jgi:hypothetical protein
MPVLASSASLPPTPTRVTEYFAVSGRTSRPGANGLAYSNGSLAYRPASRDGTPTGRARGTSGGTEAAAVLVHRTRPPSRDTSNGQKSSRLPRTAAGGAVKGKTADNKTLLVTGKTRVVTPPDHNSGMKAGRKRVVSGGVGTAHGEGKGKWS